MTLLQPLKICFYLKPTWKKIVRYVYQKVGKPFTKNVFDQHQVVDIAKKHGFSMSQEGKFKQFVLLENSNASIVSTKTITLLEGGYWEFKVNHLNLHQHPFALPDILNVNTGDFIFSVINKANICCGNPDFKDLVTWKIHPENFQSANGADIGIIQTKCLESWDDMTIIRHKDCAILCQGIKIRCQVCESYRTSLFAMRSRIKAKGDSVINKKTNDRYLSKEELIEKIKCLTAENKKATQRIRRLSETVQRKILEDGIQTDDDTHAVTYEILDKVECPFDPETPQFLLWEQQKQQSGLRDSRAMKWHPLILRWALSIYIKSPSTYKHIRSSQFIYLPCKNTLLKYINFTDPGCGFNIDIINRLGGIY